MVLKAVHGHLAIEYPFQFLLKTFNEVNMKKDSEVLDKKAAFY